MNDVPAMLAWYHLRPAGWRIVRVLEDLGSEFRVVVLGGDEPFTVRAAATKRVDPRTVSRIGREGGPVAAYAIAPDPMVGGPHHWLVVTPDRCAGGTAQGPAEARTRIEEFLRTLREEPQAG